MRRPEVSRSSRWIAACVRVNVRGVCVCKGECEGCV